MEVKMLKRSDVPDGTINIHPEDGD